MVQHQWADEELKAQSTKSDPNITNESARDCPVSDTTPRLPGSNGLPMAKPITREGS